MGIMNSLLLFSTPQKLGGKIRDKNLFNQIFQVDEINTDRLSEEDGLLKRFNDNYFQNTVFQPFVFCF